MCTIMIYTVFSKTTSLAFEHILTVHLWMCVFSSHGNVRQMVSELFRKVQDGYIQQRELGWRGKGLRQQPSTAASHFLQSLTELTTRLER